MHTIFNTVTRSVQKNNIYLGHGKHWHLTFESRRWRQTQSDILLQLTHKANYVTAQDGFTSLKAENRSCVLLRLSVFDEKDKIKKGKVTSREYHDTNINNQDWARQRAHNHNASNNDNKPGNPCDKNSPKAEPQKSEKEKCCPAFKEANAAEARRRAKQIIPPTETKSTEGSAQAKGQEKEQKKEKEIGQEKGQKKEAKKSESPVVESNVNAKIKHCLQAKQVSRKSKGNYVKLIKKSKSITTRIFRDSVNATKKLLANTKRQRAQLKQKAAAKPPKPAKVKAPSKTPPPVPKKPTSNKKVDVKDNKEDVQDDCKTKTQTNTAEKKPHDQTAVDKNKQKKEEPAKKALTKSEEIQKEKPPPAKKITPCDPCKPQPVPCDPCEKSPDPCKPCAPQPNPCDPCDPCTKVMEDPCQPKKDPCVKKREDPTNPSAKKREDPCKIKDICEKKRDPCDPCPPKKEDICAKKVNPCVPPPPVQPDPCDPCAKKPDPCAPQPPPCDPCAPQPPPCDPCAKKKDPCDPCS